ncbi:MAG TPA: hypothetical protein VFA30_07945 [Gaiellaceae bacterium]|nr:hypothetical protein [Gaiellaceae bacterium]
MIVAVFPFSASFLLGGERVIEPVRPGLAGDRRPPRLALEHEPSAQPEAV